MKGDQGLRSCATGARSDGNELLEGRVGVVTVSEFTAHGASSGEHQVGELDGGWRFVVLLAGRRLKLESPHSAIGDVAQAIEGGDLRSVDAVLGHPLVHQGVAEGVGQAVREQRGQTLVRLIREARPHVELVRLAAQRHVKRREFDASGNPLGGVLKYVAPRGWVRSNSAHP